MARSITAFPTYELVDDATRARRRRRRTSFIVAAAAVGAAASWLGTDVLRLPRSAFVALYAPAALALVVAYARTYRVHPREELRKRPTVTVIATALATVAGVASVLRQSGALRAEGLTLVLELAGYGLLYGAVDALLLTVLPMHSALAVMRDRSAAARTAVALAATVFVYAAYHLGFPEFRGPSLLGPLASAVILGVAYLASRNPLAPLVAHVAMHVAAVLHGPAGTLQLPPHS